MSNCNNFIKRVIGVTRTFKWTITTNGAAVPLVAEDLTLQLVPPRGEAVSLPFDVDDNVVSFTWQGEVQHIIGCYSLILWANYGEDNQRRVDIHNFVELTPWSDRQSGEYSDLVEETIELETADFGENIMVVDNLNSTSAIDALSANMGRQLNVTKQDVIADLAAIRSGAAAGAAVKEWAKNDPLITDDATQVSASKLSFNGNIFEQWVPGIASSIGLKGIAGFLKLADISQWDSAYNDRMLPTVAAVKAKLQAVLTALATIEAVIPSQASSTNKLTDKDYVDGAIATNTANFVGTFDTLAELQAVQNPTKNDYGFVIEQDAQGNEYYDRYKYTGTQWLYEYKVESTPFTTEQWAAIQSGITAALVTKLSALPTNAELNTALAAKQPVINDLTTIRSGAAAGATAYQKPAAGIPASDTASAVQTTLIEAKTDHLIVGDKQYNSSTFSGLGRINLERNIVSVGGTDKNVLTQAMMNTANTIYKIQYDYDLNGQTITVPVGCVLKFDGGSLSNGTINFGSTIIDADDVVCFEDVTITDCTSTQEVRTTWFGFSNVGNNNSRILQNLVESFVFVKIDTGVYDMESEIVITSDCRIREIKGVLAEQGHVKPSLYFANSNGFVIKKRVLIYGLGFSGNKGTFDDAQGLFVNGYIGIDLWVGAEIIGCDIYGWMVGVDTYNGNVIAGIFKKITISVCGNYGFRIYSTLAAGSVNANILESCYFVNNGKGGLDYGTQSTKTLCGVALYILGGAGNTIIHNVFEYNSGVGLLVDYPTSNSLVRGLSAIGNYFEYNKFANAYVNINTPNSGLVSDIVFRGNIYSDANRTLAPDSCVNRRCVIKDMFGLMFMKNLIFDDVDKTLWMTYSDGVLLDSKLLKLYNSEWEAFDSVNNAIKLDYEHRANEIEFPIAILKQGLYGIKVVAKWASGGQRALVITFRVGGGATMSVTQTIFSFWNTYTELVIGGPILVGTSNTLLRFVSISMDGSSAGDEIDLKSISIVPLNSVTTAQRNALTPFKWLKVYDSTLEKWLIYNGTTWVDVNGFPAATSVGTTSQRPTSSLTPSNAGFEFYDTTIKKSIYFTSTQGSSVIIGNVQNGQKYVSNTIAANTPIRIKANQIVKSLTSVQFVFCKTDSSTDEGIEIPFITLDSSGTGKAYTDYFYAPDPSVYPYIFIKTTYAGYTFFSSDSYTLDWREADGAVAGVLRSGATESRPASTDIYTGFQYWDTTLGRMIVWNGTAWVNMDGTALS